MKKLSIALLSYLVITHLWAAAPSKGVLVSVELTPAGSFEAKSKRIKGLVKQVKGGFVAQDISVSVRSLKTGIELRDEHLQKRLGGKKARIHVVDAKAKAGKGVGTIKVNGISKRLSFTYKVLNPKYLQVNFDLKPSDFNIKDINYMGVGVKDLIKVMVTLRYK